MAVFVFRPGGVQQDNVFTNWETLVDAMLTVEGRKILEFDDSVQPQCVIPPVPIGRDAWQMKDVSWAGFGPRPGKFRPVVHILEGAKFSDFRMIGGQITIENHATTTSPISDFKNGDHVQIGLRDDAGNTELINEGAAPLFTCRSQLGFFLPPELLVWRQPTSTHPLIRYVIPAGPPPLRPLVLNLLGQNQTGKTSSRRATARRSCLARSAPRRRSAPTRVRITDSGGIFRFLPVGRIQRQVLPLPPAAACTTEPCCRTSANSSSRCQM